MAHDNVIMDMFFNMVKQITFERETVVMKAFQMCGFDKQFLLDHHSDFRIIEVPDVVENFYYKKILLFSVYHEWDIDQNLLKYMVEFHYKKGDQNDCEVLPMSEEHVD